MPEQIDQPVNEAATASTQERRRQYDRLEARPGTPVHIDEQFRLLVETVKDYAIFMLDTHGNILTWNQGAERIKGYKAVEIIGRHFSCFYPLEDVKNGLPEKALLTAVREGRVETEGWRIRKDGSRFWAHVVMTALYDPRGQLIAFSKITQDLSEHLKKEEALRTSRESMRTLSAQLLWAQDDERRRIGRNLHDGVSQYLAMLKMHLKSLRSGSAQDETIDETLADCVQLAEQAMKEVRATSYELCPPMLEEGGLASAVPWYLDGFMERSGIRTESHISDFDRLPRDIELAIFRVLQECLANARRHSGSPTVCVRLERKENTVRLEVTDQGSGIPPQILDAFVHDFPGKMGVGMRSMKERIRQLGGNMNVTSTGCGTAVSVTVPVKTIPQSRKISD